MIYLVEGQKNTVWLEVESSIDINGFQAVLAICGKISTATDLTAKSIRFDFTPEEVATTSRDGTYGMLVVYDVTYKEYIKFRPQFKLVSESEAHQAIGRQTIYLTVSSTFDGWMSYSPSAGGSDTYVTITQLQEAIQQSNRYTDSKINDIGEVVVTETPIVVEQGGETVNMTVLQAMEKVVETQNTVEKLVNNKISGAIIDEDDDGNPDDETLYLFQAGS